MLERIQEQQFRNFLRTAALIVGMLALMLTVGFLFMGWEGILWAAILGGFSIFATYRVPTRMIMRFYRAQPLPGQQLTDLHHINYQFAKKAGLSVVPTLYYIPSNQVNAFATGSKEDPAIALTYGLLRSLTLKEISGVMAHELSHIVNNDVRLQQMAMLINRMTRVFSFVGQLLFIFNLSSFMMGTNAISWLAIILLIIAPYLANVMQMALSRTREFDADLQAAKITEDPNALADALQRLHSINRYRMPAFQRRLPIWLSTHPNIEERIKRLRDLAPRFKMRFPIFL